MEKKYKNVSKEIESNTHCYCNVGSAMTIQETIEKRKYCNCYVGKKITF